MGYPPSILTADLVTSRRTCFANEGGALSVLRSASTEDSTVDMSEPVLNSFERRNMLFEHLMVEQDINHLIVFFRDLSITFHDPT